MKKLKTFVSGLIVGMLIMGTVFASNDIVATFTDFNFKVNGQVQKIQTKPLVYNGTSYLPVREVANLLGYDVDYKADTKTIELSSQKQAETGIIKETVPVEKEVNNMPNKIMDAGELVNLLATKYPEARDTISLGNSGDLQFNGKTYSLTVDYQTRTVDITPLIEAGILD